LCSLRVCDNLAHRTCCRHVVTACVCCHFTAFSRRVCLRSCVILSL